MIEERPIPWRELLEGAFRQRRVIFGTTLGALVLALMVAWLSPPQYRAKARVLLTAQGSGPRQAAMSDKQIQAELALLKTQALLRSVLQEHRQADLLPTRAMSFRQRIRALLPGAGSQNLRGSAGSVDTVETLAERIEAESVGQSNVVEVSFSDSDPVWAARFVNDLLAGHLERIASLSEEGKQRSFFRDQSDLLLERWQSSQEALIAFRETRGSSMLSGDEAKLRGLVAQLEGSRVATETKVLELGARSQFLRSQLALYPETIESATLMTENESVKFLKPRILALEIERSELLSRYTENATPVQDLDRQLEQARRLLAEKEGETLAETTTATNPAFQALQVDMLSTEAELTAANARVSALTTQIDSYRQELRRLEGAAQELALLQNEVDAAEAAHQDYVKQEEAARLSTALDAAGNLNVSIVEQAEPPVVPEPSRSRFWIQLSTVTGLILGLGLAYLRDWLDPSVKSSLQATRLTGVPVIAEIPSQ